jgi:DoxX-like family
MSIARTVVTVVAALWVGFSAVSVLLRAGWIRKALTDYGVPRSWWTWLGVAKLAGSAGLVIGLFVPWIGVAAAAALIVYFTGAVITVVRAHWYSHIPYPLVYVAPVIAVLALRFAA